MTSIENAERISALVGTLGSVEKVLDLPALRASVADLEAQASAPDLWDDQAKAQAVTSRLSFAQGEVRRFESLQRRLDDLPILFELAEAEGDAGAAAEAEAELESLEAAIAELEVRTLLSGEYDAREALVTIRAEAGGVDAADWAEMLLRMYTRYCERHGWTVEVYDTSYAEEAGIKSATFAVKAPYAYGTLGVEQGTHRLVRISPFDNQGRRQTSFATVQIWPVLEEVDIEINEGDIRMEVFRASGAGGQHVNKTSSAVRLIHEPTGLVASSQQERSQLQNRENALKRLKTMVAARIEEEREEALRKIAGKSATVGWGSQIRSYVMQPYQMVKDLRTDTESGNVAGVLDGDLDAFMEGYLRWRRAGAES